MAIKSLKLINFRNHYELDIAPNCSNVAISGPNGAGKTNILEAISFLSPGKGIFNAAGHEVLNTHNLAASWQVFAELQTPDNDHKVGSGFNKFSPKRIVRINESEPPRHHDLLEYLRVIWLIPQMDGILADTPSMRRRFVDRLTFNFYPEHAAYTNRYEYALKSRNKLLQDGPYDEILLNNFEKMMADEAIKITIFRKEAIGLITKQMNNFQTEFLAAQILLHGDIEEKFATLSKDSLGDEIMNKLKNNRKFDALIKKCSYGVHKTEIKFIHPTKQVAASFCSTGEKKAMLISLVIAQSMVLQSIFNGSIILLLDDIFSHLDNTFSQNLLTEISKLSAQSWITGTHTQALLGKDYVTFTV